jgi:hypothetical protein
MHRLHKYQRTSPSDWMHFVWSVFCECSSEVLSASVLEKFYSCNF